MPSEFVFIKQGQAPLTEIGTSGLRRQGGFIMEEFLPRMQGQRARKIFAEMRDNDPIVGAFLFAIDMLVRKVRWRVEPAGQAADFLLSCLDDMNQTFDDIISEILSFLVYGWSYHEEVFKIRSGQDAEVPSKFNDGRIGWRKLPIRGQESLSEWMFDGEGGIMGMWQSSPPLYSRTFIPIQKALLFRTTVRKNNPEGRSILRNCFRSWTFKKRIEEIEGIGIERDLAGLPIAWVPPEILSENATDDQASMLSEIKKIVTGIRRDEQEGVVFPLVYDNQGNKRYDLQLLSTGGRRQFDTDKIVTRYDQRIAMTVLADFILLGHEAVGSFALSSSKTNLFSTALTSFLDAIAGVFNRWAIPRLFSYNNFGDTETPRLIPGRLDVPDLKELGAYISRLVGAGMNVFPNAALENYLLEAGNLPLSEDSAQV